MFCFNSTELNFLKDVSIHPCTRKLLRGKKPKFGPGTAPTPKPSCASSTAGISLKPAKLTAGVDDLAIKVEPGLIPSYVGPKVEAHRPESEPRGLQHKRKRRIIVGNVSKWIECDQREDLSTHKVFFSSSTFLLTKVLKHVQCRFTFLG